MKISAIQTLVDQVSLFTLALILAMSSFAVALPLFFAPSAGAVSGSEQVYDALPGVDPQTSYPGHGYEANKTSQLADSINLGGSNRRLETVTVTLNSGAKLSQYSGNPAYPADSTTWSQEVTVNVYSTQLDENGVPNTLLATSDPKAFDIPWSPEDALNGIATDVTLDFSGIYVPLPKNIIVGVEFNTQNYGVKPTGVVGPYNALSVATPDNQPLTMGTDANVDGVFLNSTSGTRLAGLKADTGWSPRGTLALRVTATEAVLATPPTTGSNEGAGADVEDPTAKTDEPSLIAEIAADFPAIVNPSSFVGIAVGNSQRSDSSVEEADAIRNNSTNTVRTTAATTSDSEANQGTFYGISWYWWLLAIAALTTAAWWVGLANRNRSIQ